MSLCLCDTNATEDLHINDELVTEKYAICPEINSPPAASSPNGQVRLPFATKKLQIENGLNLRVTYILKWNLIVHVKGVLRRTVGGDMTSESSDSEDDFCSGC